MNISEVTNFLAVSPYFQRVDWNKIDLSMLLEKTIQEMPDEYDQNLFYERLANRSGSFSNLCTEYDNLASLILIRLHEQKTPASFLEVIRKLQENKDVMGRDRPILSPEFVEFILENAEKVESLYQSFCRECFLPSMFGWKTLMRSYLLKSNGVVVERFPHMLFRVALFIHDKDWEKTTVCYRDLLDGKYTHATPTLFHAGTRRAQMASCFLPDTHVWTPSGKKPISEINPGDLMFTHTGHFQKVAQIHKNHRNNRKLFRLHTVFREVATATEDHEFMVFDSTQGKTGWKPLNRLTGQDYILQPFTLPKLFPSHPSHLEKTFKNMILHAPRLIGNIIGQIYQSATPISEEIRVPFYTEDMCSKTFHSLHSKSIPCKRDSRDLVFEESSLIEVFQTHRQDILETLITNGNREVYLGMLDVMVVHRWETFDKKEAELLCILLNVFSEGEWKTENLSVVSMVPVRTNCFCSLPPTISIDGRKFVRFHKRVRSHKDEKNHTFVYTLGVEKDHSYCVDGVIAKNCFLLGTNDSVEGIFKTIADCAQISKWAGGIGVHLSNIRANKSYIYGTNGNSNGILPMLKVYNDVSRYIDQCFTPDVLLFTKKGMVPIGHIYPGDMVLSAHGQFQKVNKVVTHPWDGKILSINGWRATEEHNFLCHSPDSVMDYKSLEETSSHESFVFPRVSFYDASTDQRVTPRHLQLFINIFREWGKKEEGEYVVLSIPPYEKDLEELFLDYFLPTEWSRTENNLIIRKKAWEDRLTSLCDDMKKISTEKQKRLIQDLNEKSTELLDLMETLKIVVGWNCVARDKIFTLPIQGLQIQETTYSGKVFDLEMEGDPSYVTVIGTVHNGGGKRNGAFAMYIEPWHADIQEFINAKRNIGAEDERARDLFYGLWIPDLFMERVEKNQEWSLFCPSIAPGLPDVIGEDFRRLYETYEREKRYTKQVKARELWSEILRSQIETGTPYMLYKDSCNFKSNQQNLGIIKSSNLCVSGRTKILTPEGMRCIMKMAGTETKVWNGTAFVPVKVLQTGTQQELMVIVFSNGNHLECTPYHKFYLMKEGKEVKVEACELKKGDLISPFRLPVVHDIKHPIIDWIQEKGIVCDDFIYLYSSNEDSLRESLLDLQTIGIQSVFHQIDDNRFCLRLSRNSFRSFMDGTHVGDLVDNLRVESTDLKERFGDTFCFTEPETGKGWFDGVVTGQCTEIIEFSDDKEYACCNLSSIALPRFLKPNPKKGLLEGAVAYTKKDCPFCCLLELEFPDIQKKNVEDYKEEWAVLKEKHNLTTVPAVFLGETYLGGFTDVWKSHLTPVFDFDELYRVVYAVTENLNKVIDLNVYPVPETERSNMKHRPVGIGVQGLADVFGKMRLAFDEKDAQTLNRDIFETLYFGALQASSDLALTQRPYSSFKGSPLSKGIFHFDLQTPIAKNKSPTFSGRYDWETLRQKIIQQGVRNSLLIAPMPTASTSQILGNTECFEPWTSNIFLRRTNAGEFYVCNSLLQRDLKALGLWNQQNMDQLILQQGSVAKFPIPNYLKHIYRTVWEIPQRNLLDMAVERQFFIDQSQSLNLFVTNPSLDLLTKIHFYGWKNGLKTGCYYIRSRAPVSSINFAIESTLTQPAACEACSA